MFRVTVVIQDIDNHTQVTIKDLGTENSLKTYLDEIDFSKVVNVSVNYQDSSIIIFD